MGRSLWSNPAQVLLTPLWPAQTARSSCGRTNSRAWSVHVPAIWTWPVA